MMNGLTTWKKAWELLDRRERRNFSAVLGIVVLAALSSAAMIGSVMPFLTVLADPDRIRSIPVMSWIYNAGGFTSDYTFLVALGIASLCVIIVSNLIQVLRAWAVSRFALMRIYSLSHRLLAAYLRQPYEFFLDHHSGEMSTQILAECAEAVNRFFRPAVDVITSILTIVAIVALLLWINPVVALVAFAVLGSLYGGTYWFTRRVIARKGKVRAASNRERFRLANEALGGVKDIKLLGREATYVDRFRTPARRMAHANLTVQVLSVTPQYAMQAVGFGGVILLCLLLMDPEGLASGTALGNILPLIGVFAFAGQRLLPEIAKLYQSLTQLNYGAAAVETVHRDLLSKTGPELPRSEPKSLGLKKELRLEDITYSYPSAERTSLHAVSLSIHAGEKVGIVGSTGAGKTTVADMILGLLRPHAGFLAADGVRINDENLRAWQRTVGYVPQDIFLTDSSIAENVALGLSPGEIDKMRLIRAAEIAQIDKFVREDLPKGYDTLVGDRGVRLSGGQRQRIGIARALYHDADLIVFDEATSALDNLTEREVMKAIEDLPGDKTILLIAHRLSTLKVCDRIVVLEKGVVVGFDSWANLMSDNKYFQDLASAA